MTEQTGITENQQTKFTKRLTRWEIDNLTVRFGESDTAHLKAMFPDAQPKNIYFDNVQIGRRTCNFETQTLTLGLSLKECRPGDGLVFQNYSVDNTGSETGGDVFIFLLPKSINAQERFSQTYLRVRDLLQSDALSSECPETKTILYLMNENKHLLEENSRLFREQDTLRKDNEKYREVIQTFRKNPLIIKKEDLVIWLSENLSEIHSDLKIHKINHTIEREAGDKKTIEILALSPTWGLVLIHVYPWITPPVSQEIFSAILSAKESADLLSKGRKIKGWDGETITPLLFSMVQPQELVEKCLVNKIKLVFFRNGYFLEVVGS